jgi:hypothetical protein
MMTASVSPDWTMLLPHRVGLPPLFIVPTGTPLRMSFFIAVPSLFRIIMLPASATSVHPLPTSKKGERVKYRYMNSNQ